MNQEYYPPKYAFEDMTHSFQADLCESDEQINESNFAKACKQSEQTSLYTDVTSEGKISDFIQKANTFDARLIGIINEWSSAKEKGYTRDGILLDEKTASALMWEKGCTFLDVVCLTQKALDNPEESPYHKVQLSIGGPAFMTNENVLESVKKQGQINATKADKSELKEVDFSKPREEAGLAENVKKNREQLLTEQSEEKTSEKLRMDLEELEDYIEREEQALELFSEDSMGLEGNEQQVEFFVLSKSGQVNKCLTTNKIVEQHKSQLSAMKDEDFKKQQNNAVEKKTDLSEMENHSSQKVPLQREKMNFNDLEEKPKNKEHNSILKQQLKKEPVKKSGDFSKT